MTRSHSSCRIIGLDHVLLVQSPIRPVRVKITAVHTIPRIKILFSSDLTGECFCRGPGEYLFGISPDKTDTFFE